MPFYNRSAYLPEALQSISDQMHMGWTAIFYDDGSTDDGASIIREWLKENPGELIISKENKGIGYSRNILLDQVKTPFACWLDSDDIMEPDRLHKQRKVLINGADICFSYLKFFKEDDDMRGRVGIYKIDIDKYKDRDSLQNNMAFATAMFTKRIAETYKFDNKKRRKEDVDWVASMIGKEKIGIVRESLYRVRKHAGRTTV